MQYVLATVPALVSYSDGQGNSAPLHYPIAGPQAPGDAGKRLPVTARPNGDVLVTLTFWRPQRRPIPPETAQWIDIGRLNYTAGPGDGSSCQQSDFSETDPNLRPLTKADVGNNNYFGVKDLAPDRPANPVNTFTYTLNLTRCLASGGTSFNPGETRTFSFPTISPNGGDGAEQNLSFKRQ